ncbi:MAG: ribonuclease E inhibitor RraB [Corallincola sp.]|nr:ribonuclease E inhibitor RraB [Corallincola sp.]
MLDDAKSRSELLAENREIVAALTADGTNLDAEHIIEHHFAADNFDRLEKLAVAAFNLGFEVTDAEELELDRGQRCFCCDVITENLLDLALLDAQTEQMLELAAKHGVIYDGWGTYLEE